MERHIRIPNPISFTDPTTGESTGESLTFRAFIMKLMDNPKWVQSYRMIKSAEAINKALDLAIGAAEDMKIDDEDWKNLAEAVENPKSLFISPNGLSSIIPGFGMHPRIITQILPFCDAIMHAPQAARRLTPQEAKLQEMNR